MNERERAAVRQAPLLTASSKPLPERLRRKLLVRLVPFVALGYALCFIDRSNISFAELSMRNDTELHLSDADFGLSSGLFFVGYALAQVPALHIAQLVGARYVFTVLLLLWGGVSTSLCLISSTTQLCALRFLLGLVEAGYYPLMVYYLSTWFPDEWLGAATGFTTMTGISFGLTTGTLTSGALLSWHHLDGLLGWRSWRWLFLLQGLPTVAAGVLVFLFQPDSPHTASFLTEEERHLLLARLPCAATPHTTRSSVTVAAAAAADTALTNSDLHLQVAATTTAAAPAGSREMAPPLPLLTAVSRTARHASTWVFCAQHFGGCSLIYLAVFFLPLLLSELNPLWPPWLVACVVAAPLLLSVVTAVTGGAVTDAPGLSPSTRRRRRVTLLVAATLTSSALLTTSGAILYTDHASSSPRRGYAVAALLCFLVTHPVASSSSGSFWAIANDMLPPELSAISIALINAVGNLGGFVGPYMVGRLKSPAHSKHVASWAPGILSVSIMVAPIMLCTSAYFCTRPVNKRRGASTSMAD